MIHKIYSSLPTFKELHFHPGLNVLIAKKEQGASDRQTRNRAGKTSIIEILHFLLGSNVDKDSMFRADPLNEHIFGIELEINKEIISVERTGNEKAKVVVSGGQFGEGGKKISNSQWIDFLGQNEFDLSDYSSFDGRTPTFRSLLAYFIRRQQSNAFVTPERQAAMQQIVDFQIAQMFLLGLDWKIASDWQKVRDREKTLEELKKAAKAGAFGSIIGKAADLRTQLTVQEDQLSKAQSQLAEFRVLPKYRELENEADDLTRALNELSNENTIDLALKRDVELAMRSEAPPSMEALEKIYSEAGVVLSSVSLRRYDEVKSFHESVIRNRKEYLKEELLDLEERLASREVTREQLDGRRSELLKALDGHGALESFAKMQGEAARLEAEVESLRQRFEAAEQLEGTKNELEIERNRLALRLRRNFSDQSDKLKEAILAFENTSKRLYENAGSMTIEDTSNGPKFDFPMQGARSKGIKNMQIFCFDMMHMQLCAKNQIGPNFLVHDSHLFDGVDGRQVISGLKVGSNLADEYGFQYIVTMNEDDAFKETIDGFDLNEYVLPVMLTDASEDGGLFGCRFG